VHYVVQKKVRAIFFFEATFAGTAYLTVLEDKVMPYINILLSAEDCYFQYDGAPQHYHTDVIRFLGICFPRKRRGRRSVEYPPRSSDLTSLDFDLLDTLKNIVYSAKPRTLQDLNPEIQISCASIQQVTCNKYDALFNDVESNVPLWR
jgi:hypothetical protein